MSGFFIILYSQKLKKNILATHSKVHGPRSDIIDSSLHHYYCRSQNIILKQ